jgi:sulfatase maturation enzyme AslB (radical SAM superfamily)
VYLAGGEPLLIKENVELLERLQPRQHEVTIRVNTNLSLLNTEVFKRLSNFDNVKWTISVDAIEQHYEYIRYPGNWKTFVDNLVYLKSTGADINFNLVWFILNSESIFDCFDYLSNLGFHENTFVTQPLIGPAPLGIWNLPDHELSRIKQLIKHRMSQTDSAYWLYKSLSLMYNFIDSPKDKDIESTRLFLETIDQRRKLDHRKIFKNLYNQ